MKIRNPFKKSDPLKALLVDSSCGLPRAQDIPHNPPSRLPYRIYGAEKVEGKMVVKRNKHGNYKAISAGEVKDRLTIGDSRHHVFVRLGRRSKWVPMFKG